MIAINLIDILDMHLTKLFRGYSLLNKYQVLQEVKIFKQYIPQPKSITPSEKITGIKNYSEKDYEANFPCIIIRHIEATDNEERRLEMTTHRVKLVCGVYDDKPECEGWRDILSMIERIKFSLLTERILKQKFRLNMPVKSRLLDVDSWPVYFGEIDLVFEGGRAVQPPGFVYQKGEYVHARY